MKRKTKRAYNILFGVAAAFLLTACAGEKEPVSVTDTRMETEAPAASPGEEKTEAVFSEEEPVYGDRMMGVTDDGFHYFIREGYAFISGIPEGTRRLVIPEKIGGLPVAGIDELRWGDLEEVEEIVMPESCFWIAEDDILESKWREKNYDFENMVNANGEPLGDFLYCGNVLIGDIGDDTYVNVPEGTLGIGTNAFGLTLTSENITDLILPEGLIGLARQSCFCLDKLVTLELPESLEAIGEEAFEACYSLQYLELPEGLKILDAGAFNGTPWLHELCQENEEEFLVIGPGTLVGYNGTAEYVVIPDGVVTVNEGVLSGHEEIKSIVFPSSVYSVGLAAFADCTGLEMVDLNEGLCIIESRAFSGCPSLNSIELPSTVWVAAHGWCDEGVEITGKNPDELRGW